MERFSFKEKTITPTLDITVNEKVFERG